MPSPFDQFAKEVIDLLLFVHGRLETEVEVPAPPTQRADVFFQPDPTHDDSRRALGLIGRMTDAPCLFEPFHQAPGVDTVRDCVRKLLNHQYAAPRRPVAQRMWLLCAGRPDAALAAFRAQPTVGWPRGFYDLGDGLALSFVVLSELEPTDENLPLRLMGAGTTLRNAIATLARRYREFPRGRELLDALVCVNLAHLHPSILQELPMLKQSDAAVVADYIYDLFKDEGRNEGRSLGISEGRSLGISEGRSLGISEGRSLGISEGRHEGSMHALVRVVERRLRRPLTTPEHTTLCAHLERDGDAAFDTAIDASPEALAAWLLPAP